jgi:hypothetical protein
MWTHSALSIRIKATEIFKYAVMPKLKRDIKIDV